MNQQQDAPRTGLATSRLRMWGYAAVLTALAFSQSAGRMVADTKFDLVTNPAKFLGNAFHFWDSSAAFGQLQNQAYGYAWPMGPFFLVGHLAALPEWVVQRLWWALLLCLGFFGVVRVAQRLAIGSPLTQVIAGFAYVLTPRITTLIGGASVEIWPMALAPWVLLPLIRGSREGSVRRAAALSALVVACCGGVNAVAVAAVLPLGAIWILTREGGPRKWRLFGWWTLFTALATAWWSLPLLLLARYSVPFLDYIENATITSVPTGLGRTLVGTSDWVAYFAGIDYPAGQQLVTTQFLLLDAAAVAAVGLIGVCLRGNPERRFLGLGVVAGVALVGFGYSGDLAGFLAADRTELLDGALAPLRNLHKFDVVLRIPLVLGLAHLLAVLPGLVVGRGARIGIAVVRGATVLALAALAMPYLQDQVAPRGGVLEVPDYWSETASYLESTDDGTVSLVVPASAFGVYSWGNTHDDVMQGLAASPWAVRNVIPLAQPGNVVFLDAVTRYLESGRPSDGFAELLAANGVGRLVVRNDLERFRTGAPDPSYVAGLLDNAPGITLAESFGPTVGSDPVTRTEEGDVRLISGSGLSVETGSVDVYDVSGTSTASLTTGTKALVGDPASTLDPAVADATGGQPLLAEDAEDPDVAAADGAPSGQVLTDGMRRRETDFSAVRWNESSTMPADTPYALAGPEHEHRVVDDPERWQTTEEWEGLVEGVDASTSQSDASAVPPLLVGSHPGAALDGDPATAWRSARHLAPTGEFWQVDYNNLVSLDTVTVTLAPDSAPVSQIEFWAGGQRIYGDAPEPGKSRTYRTNLGTGRFLRITAAGDPIQLPGSFAISEVSVPRVGAQRYLQLPDADPDVPVDVIALERDPDRTGCVAVGDAFPCNAGLVADGEDGDQLARRFDLDTTVPYTVTGTVSLRRSISGQPVAATGLIATSDATTTDVAAGPTAMVDGDPGTTWIAQTPDESVQITFPFERKVRRFRVEVAEGAAASRPTIIQVSSEGRTRNVALDKQGRGRLPVGWEATKLRLRVVSTEPAFLIDGTSFVQAPAGISSITFGGKRAADEGERASRQVRPFACGTGPQVAIDDYSFQTAVVASTSQLMRGESVDLRVCDVPQVFLNGSAAHRVVVLPSAMFRADTLQLTREGGAPRATTQPLTVVRDDRGDPASVRVPERSGTTVLTLPQNVNTGWVATLDGQELTPTRVAGWKQAWLVPAGEAGEVRFDYPPQQTFERALLIGLLGVLVVLAVVLVPLVRRRPLARELPALGTAPVRPLDVLVLVGVGGLLVGWWGLVATAVGVALARIARRRFSPWPVLAGLGLLASALGLVWKPIAEKTWAVEWTQAWSLVAFVCLAAALVVTVQRRPRRFRLPRRLSLRRSRRTASGPTTERRSRRPGRPRRRPRAAGRGRRGRSSSRSPDA